jgi:hypothetical protein
VTEGKHLQHTAIELGLQQEQFVIAELLTVVELMLTEASNVLKSIPKHSLKWGSLDR